ncbi:MAG: hypothetical protein AAFO07_22705 [Bacteroidota bacterium]
MNKKYVYFLLLFVFQVIYLPAQNYLDYYQEINQGRLHLLEEKLDAAIDSYYTTFETFDFVFARDCYHTMELAVLAGDTMKLDYFIRRGLQRGIKMEFLLNAGLLDDYKEAAFMKAILVDQDQLAEQYQASINWDIRAEIIGMFAADQAIRKRYYDATLFKRKKIGKEWEALNKKQVERMIEITKEYGFPGEKLIGIASQEMHEKVDDGSLAAIMPIIIFIHHYSQPNPSYNEILIEQIPKGNLHNKHFATICDFEAEFGKGKYPNLGYFAFNHKPKKLDMEAINKRRQKVKLLSIQKYDQLFASRKLKAFWVRLY